MTRIKLCGLSEACDIEAANRLQPDYIGFIFAPKSKRYVSIEKAAELKKLLSPSIIAIGVFVREPPAAIATLLEKGIIDIAQLHGNESEDYIKELRARTDKPLIKAFRIGTKEDIKAANTSSADYVLLDSGQGGTGTTFDWRLLEQIGRPYFLAGGLNAENIRNAIDLLHPYAVDVSSGIETGGHKDPDKMEAFVHAVRTFPGRSSEAYTTIHAHTPAIPQCME